VKTDRGFKLLKAQAVEIGPVAATNMLQCNTYEAQRNTKDKHLDELVDVIQSGLWRAAEVSIAIMPDGTKILVNGQHTLMACIMADTKIFIFEVKYRVTGPKGLAALYMTFDLGRGARSIGDAVKAELHSLNLDWKLSIASMISSAAASIEDKSFRPSYGKAAQAHLIVKYMEQGQFVIDLFDVKPARYMHLKRSPVVRAMMEIREKYPKPAEEFWRLVRDGEEGSKKTPANMIRNYLLVLPSPWDRKMLYAKCLIAFNAFKAGQSKLRGLEYDPEQPLPEVGE